MDIKDSYLHGTVGVVKSISVDADKLKYKLADIVGTIREVTLPLVTTTANGLMSSADKKKLDAFNLGSLKNNLVLKINSGTTEGTNLYTYNGSTAKTLDIKNGAGIGFTNTAGSLQIYNSGVRAIATGTTNGTISVNTNGTSKDVAVKGLESAAYTPSTNYLNLKTYVSPYEEKVFYKKITVTKNVTDGYGIWLHSRQQHFLANSGCLGGTSYCLKFYELGTNLNGTTTNTSRSVSIKMVATYNSSNITFYVKINGYNYLQVVSSGTISILDSTQSEYDGITSSTQGYIPCTYAKWTDTTYTFKNGTSGNFTVTPLGGTAQTISVGKPATSGTADIAVKLQTKRKLWGLDFDGTADVSGNMTGVGSISMNGNINIISGNTDKYITFDTAISEHINSWRIGYIGSGNGNENYFILQSTRNTPNTWTSALTIANQTLESTFVASVTAPTFIGNLDGTYVNKLTNYTIATAIGSIAATDSLNTALGKLEFKTNFIYNDLFGTDNDDVINKWHEIVNFIDSVKEGTDITDEFVTRKTALTITGAKIFSGTSASLLTIDRNDTNPTWIRFAKANNLLGYIGIDNNKNPVVHVNDKVLYILHSGNSFIKDGIITINGTSITPLTTHQSLANYVTLNTALTISGVKTFSTQLKFTVAQGTSPFTVISTTKVDNLNADLLDGKHASTFATAEHNHTFILGATIITTNGSKYNSITGPFNINTDASANKAFSISRSSAYERVKHWISDSTYNIEYINDETINSIAFRFINTDSESPHSPSQASDTTIYLDSLRQFYPNINNTGNIGTSIYKWANMYATIFHGSLDGNASSATKLTSSAGSATLPIYFSDGKPVACTPSSLFSNLSNNGNNLSITVAGLNRTLTVNYASNASSAEYLNNYIISDPNTEALKNNKVKWFAKIPSTTNGSSGYAGNNYGFPVSNNANGILYLGTHSGKYGHQLGFSSNGNIYHRFQNDSDFPLTANGGSWSILLTSTNYSSILDNRYYTETEADNRFVNVTGDTMTGTLTLANLSVTSGADTTELFRIYSSTGYKNGLSIFSIDNKTYINAKPYGFGTVNALYLRTYNSGTVDALTLAANGNATFIGSVTASSFIGNASSATILYTKHIGTTSRNIVYYKISGILNTSITTTIFRITTRNSESYLLYINKDDDRIFAPKVTGERLKYSKIMAFTWSGQDLYIKANAYSNGIYITLINGTPISYNVTTTDLTTFDSATPIVIELIAFLTSNVASATKLQTARTLTIGNTGKSFDGSANVSWSLVEIGASANTHTHSVKINGVTKTIAASSGAAVDLGNYLPISGGTMLLGEGLKFHSDENYFGTNLDARIISLLDGNGTTCDGGLIIDERATSNGTLYITELLRIRDSEFKWRGLNILHTGNFNSYSPTLTGTGASGIWNININGNASTANRIKSIIVVDSKAFSLSNASWTDTGYTFASLATGTYAVQVTFGTTLVASGIMSVYNNLSDTAGDEIPLHVYGTAGWRPYLRTYANKLLISSNDISATSRTITIKIALIL